MKMISNGDMGHNYSTVADLSKCTRTYSTAVALEFPVRLTARGVANFGRTMLYYTVDGEALSTSSGNARVPYILTSGGIGMAVAEKEAQFNVPVDKAFNVIADIRRWPEWVPPLTSVSNLSGSGLGTTYNWEFKLGPLPTFSGKGEVIKFAPNEVFAVQTHGIPSVWSFAFSGQGNQSVVKMAIEYDIPGGGMAAGLVTRQIEEGLGLLKGLLEK